MPDVFNEVPARATVLARLPERGMVEWPTTDDHAFRFRTRVPGRSAMHGVYLAIVPGHGFGDLGSVDTRCLSDLSLTSHLG